MKTRSAWLLICLGIVPLPACAQQFTWHQAAFNRESYVLWSAVTALNVADTEFGFRKSCFRAGICPEMNPLLGNTRRQQYSVRMGGEAATWMFYAALRRKHKRYAWVVPATWIVVNSVSLALNAHWNPNVPTPGSFRTRSRSF